MRVVARYGNLQIGLKPWADMPRLCLDTQEWFSAPTLQVPFYTGGPLWIMQEPGCAARMIATG